MAEKCGEGKLPDRQVPALGNEKVKLRKAIDLSKLSMQKLKVLFKKLKGESKKTVSHYVHIRRSEHAGMITAQKRKKRNRRRNEIAKESRKENYARRRK